MHKFKRIGSLLMALAMMVSLIPNVGAAEVYEDTGDDAYFDLNAEEYEFREDAGDQSIIVKRTGNLGVEVDVAFKVADFLTTYGEDYVVLDAAGKPLAKVDGVKPDVSDITVEESDAGIIEEAPPALPEAAVEEPPVETEPAATEEPVAETEPAATETPAEVAEEPAETTETPAEVTEEPAEATETPAETTETPAEVTEEPAEATETPAETTEEAAEVAEEAVEATEEAAEVAEEPAETTEEAVEATEEAAEVAEEPVEATEEAAEVAEEAAETTEEPAETTEEAVEDTAEQVVEVETDNDANMAALSEETAVLSDAAAVEEPAEVAEDSADADAANVKRAYSTGSPLRDAAYGYLGIDGEQAELQSAELSQTEREIEQLLTETNAYFQSAQGAEGVLHFDRGETEKAIVVRPTNDEQSNGTRVFLVALMGVLEGQRGRIAPDANSYVSLIDDEEREAPAYSLAASNTTLTADAPEATVTVTRTSGLADFSTAYLSTIKPTTDAAPTYEYQQFNGRSVQFLPGETEKEVTIKALYFDRSGKFGVRLEAAEENATFGNTYAEFTIRATDAEGELIPAAPEVELMAAPVEISEEPGEPKEAYEPAQLLDGSISMSRGNGGVWTGSQNVSGKNQQTLTFVAPVTGNYTLESTNTNGGSSCDPYVHLYNSNRSEIATNDDGAGNRNFRISRQMNAGETYYYGVRYYYDSNSGDMSLRLTLDPEGLSAPRMAGKTTGTATISAGGGEKIYSITPTVSGSYTFKSTNSSGDPYGYLYDANRNQLASNDDGAGNRNFLITQNLTAGTTYYLGVAFYGGSATGTVSFELAAPMPTIGPIGRAEISPDGMWNGSFSYDVWGTAKTGSDGDNYAYLSYNAIWVGQYDEDEYSYGYTKRPYDMTGVHKLRFYSSMGGDGSNFHTIFETDTDQTWPGSINSTSKNGQYGLQHTYLSVADQNRELYIKWGAKADDWGRQNPRGWLENVTFFYTFYRLNAKESVDTFQRKVYDFTSTTANGKSPQSFATYWDNPHQMAVAPGINLFGTTGFYANDVGTVLIEPDDTAAQNGLTLAGVYLCRSSNLTSTPTSNYHYIAANSDGSVTFQNTQAFVRTLISANVVNSTNGETEDIYIYPKFTQKKVTLTFENTDARNKSGGGRQYDAANPGSAFANVVALWQANGSKTAANDNGIIWKTTDSGKNDVYKVRLPWKSVVRLRMEPDPTATPNGIRYRTSYNGQSTVTSFTLGQRIYSSNTDGYSLVDTEDLTKGEFVLDAEETLVVPNTNTQTLYIGYSPTSYNSFRSQILPQTGRSDLTGVARVGNISDLSGQQETTTDKAVTDTTGMQTSGADGSIMIDPARTGDAYTVTAMSPEGYYTSWANMSEDRNNDGKKDADAPARSKVSRSDNPQYVYGDEINVQLDIDNMRYYYKFIKQMNEGSGELISGSVVRERNTFLRLVNHEPPIKGTPVKRNGVVINRPEVEGEPVAGANVSISGSYGMTNAMGEYEVEIPITEDWGAVSFRVSADGSNYYGQVYIEDEEGLTILPALERFTAKAASLSYAHATSSISGSRAMITNDALTVMAQVTASGSITPAAARFYIYDKDGLVRVNCAEDPTNYRVTFDRSTYKASMTWNPKQAMQAKDTVWVQFQDNTGKWYPPINMGYTFVNEVSLNNFSLESVGGSTVDGAETTGETIEMIGNPIGNLGLGLLTGLNNPENKTTSTYVPEGLSEDVEEEYAKTVTEFKFGFSPNISFEGKWKNGERQPPDPPPSGVHLDDDTQDNLSDLNDLGKALFGATDENGQRSHDISMDRPQGGGYATESKFNWSVQPQVGFKLTLSSRAGQEGVFVEDILVYLAVDAGLGAEYAVGLPLGFQLIVRLNLSGRIAGVYYMYNEYERTDLTQSSSGSTFNQEDLGLYGSAKEVQNHTRHEGYIFFDLNLEIGLGIKWTIFYVGGKAMFGFDFDFKFDHDGTHAYGQFNYNFGVSVEVLGYEVWSKETEFDGVELFSKDADGPIEFDYAAELESAQLKALSSFSEGGSYAIDRTVNRDYLRNRTAWHGQPTVWERFASLFDAAPAGNGETVLQRGTANNPQMSLTKINDTELLMIFVGDVPTRTDANARAVFYAIGDGTTWGNPQILDDDGTIDDYPNVCDLGDGRLLVTWSSGASVLPEGATLEDSLKNLDIKAAFFDKASKTFDTPVSLTRTTEEDYSADVMPHAAYDAETGRLLLTYTKTEYNNLSEQTNLGRAVSVIAYLFYENGAWQNTGDTYTAAELDQIAAGQSDPDTYKEYYKQQWYGQRFLDLRVDRNPNAPLLRVIESDAIAYNGLALNAWTVDWDGSLETTSDRDVFLQIYNFEENSFTHIIRVTEATGQHALPRFARSDSNTYLFYGAQDFNPETGELNENGEIRYLNVSEAVRNERYTLTETDTSRYYELKYQRPEQTVEGPDGNTTIPAEVVWYPTDIAAQCNNITDYTVFVDGDGQMYLFFSDMDEENHARLIRASAYLGTDNESDSDSESAADIDGWTIPVYLTDGESVCYAGIGGVAVGSIIYLASGKSSYEDETDTSLVLVRHEPYAELTLDSVDASDDFPLPGGSTALTAVVRNIGLRSWTEPVEVTFNMTAKDADGAVLSTADVTGQYDGMIIGGAEAQVTAYVDIPETFDTLTFTATYNGETVTCERESGSFLAVTDDAIGVRVTDANDRQQYVSGVITNNGNKPSGVIMISCYTAGSGYLNGGRISNCLAPGESASFDYSIEVSDSAYEIDGDGVGLADIYASVVELEAGSVTLLDAGDELTDPSQIESANGSEVALLTGTAQKNFDAEAIQLLNNVTVPENIAFTVREDENGPLQPTLGGANAEQLRVDWISTSDPAVATIDATNAILPHTAGTATLTGIVTPKRTNFAFDADGNSARQDWRDVIPESMQREVTAEVTVLAAEPVAQPDPAPAGSHNVVFDSAGGGVVPNQVIRDGQQAAEPVAPTRTGYDFLGWQFDGENYDFSTPVTEDIQLTANWRRNDAATPDTPDNPGTPDTPRTAGCYVATSVYGSYDCPEVWTLRRFRDETLAATWYGRLFIRAYYAVSPTAVKWFGNSEWFQNFFRDKLDTLVSNLQADGFESTPYDDLDW